MLGALTASRQLLRLFDEAAGAANGIRDFPSECPALLHDYSGVVKIGNTKGMRRIFRNRAARLH